MEVSLEAYRAAIRLFNCFRMRCFKFVYSLNHADATLTFLWIAVCIVLRIVLSNDFELNPEPFFKFDHLNARSLNVGDKFEEISLLVRDDEFDVFAFFTVSTLVAKRRLNLEFDAIEFLWIEFRITP